MSEEYILNGETDNITPAAQVAAANVGTVEGGSFVVKVWSPTADWDSGTVGIYLLAPDNVAILLQEFTEDGAYFGSIGQGNERIVAGVTTVAAASADLSATVTRR